jgi:hypothetical protein
VLKVDVPSEISLEAGRKQLKEKDLVVMNSIFDVLLLYAEYTEVYLLLIETEVFKY